MNDTDLPSLTDHEAQNRASWNADSDDYQARHGEQLAASTGLAWGVMQIPEAELHVLGDVVGKDILELGCGAAQWSIALARLGARPVGIDLSERQLEHARRLMAEAGLDFPLIHGSAEHVPLPDASFDIVFCDHGAMTFADPYRTVPEAARLLRSGGLFAFSHHTPIESIAWPLDSDKVGDRLVVDYFGMHRLDDGETSTFQLPYGDWIRLFRANGLLVEELIEPRPADGATSSYRTDQIRRFRANGLEVLELQELQAPEGGTTRYEWMPYEWARRWPAEEIWRVRKA